MNSNFRLFCQKKNIFLLETRLEIKAYLSFIYGWNFIVPHSKNFLVWVFCDQISIDFACF